MVEKERGLGVVASAEDTLGKNIYEEWLEKQNKWHHGSLEM